MPQNSPTLPICPPDFNPYPRPASETLEVSVALGSTGPAVMGQTWLRLNHASDPVVGCMSQQSARRDQENPGFPPCLSTQWVIWPKPANSHTGQRQ